MKVKLPKYAATDRYQTLIFAVQPNTPRNGTANIEVRFPNLPANLRLLVNRVARQCDTTLYRVSLPHRYARFMPTYIAKNQINILFLSAKLTQLCKVPSQFDRLND